MKILRKYGREWLSHFDIKLFPNKNIHQIKRHIQNRVHKALITPELVPDANIILNASKNPRAMKMALDPISSASEIESIEVMETETPSIFP